MSGRQRSGEIGRRGRLAAVLAALIVAQGCGGGIRGAKVPKGTDAEMVCSAWLDSYLGDPASTPLAPGASVTYLGVGEDRDPRHAAPPGLIAVGDPLFERAQVVGSVVHCQGTYRLDAGDGSTALWTKTFQVALDLIWEGERFAASRATLIMDSARNESIETMFERGIAAQEPYVGRFSGKEPERFYNLVAVYQGILPGEVTSTGSQMYAEYSELLILGDDGHLRHHELLHVQPEIRVGDEVYFEKPRGSFADRKANVTAEALDLGLERTAVMFSWDEWKEVQVASAADPEGTCPVTEKWRTTSIRLLDQHEWDDIFSRITRMDQVCDCVSGCEIPGREFEGYDVELKMETFVSAPTIIDVIITYHGGGFEHERYRFQGGSYELSEK